MKNSWDNLLDDLEIKEKEGDICPCNGKFIKNGYRKEHDRSKKHQAWVNRNSQDIKVSQDSQDEKKDEKSEEPVVTPLMNNEILDLKKTIHSDTMNDTLELVLKEGELFILKSFAEVLNRKINELEHALSM